MSRDGSGRLLRYAAEAITASTQCNTAPETRTASKTVSTGKIMRLG